MWRSSSAVCKASNHNEAAQCVCGVLATFAHCNKNSVINDARFVNVYLMWPDTPDETLRT